MLDKITIAQALRRIKKLKGQIAEHTQRAQASVSYEKDKVPAFSFGGEVLSMKAAQLELVGLQSRVAVANAKATILDGEDVITHAEAIRRLQEIKGEITFLKSLSIKNEVTKTQEEVYDRAQSNYVTRVTETVWVSDLTEKNRDLQVKALQDRFEKLNNTLEDRNHKVVV
jgi:hypothetical protein